MQHLDEGTIHAWLDGSLSADEAARVELHVASCETCSDAVAEARGLIAASSRILTALDDVPRASGARWGRRDRGGRGPFLVRWRIAAVVALVVGGGALALAGRSRMAPIALGVSADSAGDLALVMSDSPAAAIQEVPVAQPSAQVRSNAVAGRGGIGAVTGSAQPRPTMPEGELTSVARADSAPPILAQLDVREAAAPPAAPPARTDDTARLGVELAAGNRIATDAREQEARSSAAAEKASEALGGVRRAGGRFAEPVAPQARLRAAPEGNAPRLLTEERTVDAGRVVVRRVYRVEETLVTLDERAPLAGAQREQQAMEERVSRVEPQAYSQAPSVDSTTTRVSTIRWVDSRGAEFTLSGPAPQAQLERFRRLLGY